MSGATWKRYSFGYDILNIGNVMEYVTEHYDTGDYRMLIGRGDDIMNGLEIVVDEDGDDELEELINSCEGQGKYEE